MLNAEYFAGVIMTRLRGAGIPVGEESQQIIVDHVRAAMNDVLYNFAWHKDGVMYVGCGAKTYKEIKEKL